MATVRCDTPMRAGRALLVAALLIAGVASAAQRSEQLYSRGLVEFHAGRFADALRLFDDAVHANPQDAQALYYRGVTGARLGNFRAAIDDLRAVMHMKPDLDQAALELGVTLVEAGQYSEAVQWLERAQAVATLDARASLFLGLAQLHLQRADQARQNFRRAAARDATLRLTAQYYEGVAYYQERQWPAAEAAFSAVTAALPDSEIGRAASGFLARIRPTLHVYGEVGFQYDSNVVLAPSNDVIKDAVGISKQQDGRMIVSVGGNYVPWRSERAQLSVGYELYQSVHFDLSSFDLQDHRPSAQFVFNGDYLRAGILGRYDFYLLADQSFLQEATALPWIEIPEGDYGRTEIFYRMRRRDFLKQPFIGLRDAFNHAAGARQFLYLGSTDRYVSAGYQFDREDPIQAVGNRFAYDGNQVDGGLGWALPAAITTELSYAYRHERYAQPSAGRRDEEHLIIAIARRELTDHLTLTLAYLGSFNKSTNPAFEYDRSIASVSLGVRY